MKKAISLFEKTDVIPWKDEDLEGKFLILKDSFFKEEYKDAKYQLVLAMSGFGCKPDARGNAIFVSECHTDKPEKYRIERYNNDIYGIATKEAVLEWIQTYGMFNDYILKNISDAQKNEYNISSSDENQVVELTNQKMSVTRVWKVYGVKEISLGDSYKYDFSEKNNTRILEVANIDKTSTTEYSIVSITRNTYDECMEEFEGQLSDGIFENYRVKKTEEISLSVRNAILKEANTFENFFTRQTGLTFAEAKTRSVCDTLVGDIFPDWIQINQPKKEYISQALNQFKKEMIDYKIPLIFRKENLPSTAVYYEGGNSDYQTYIRLFNKDKLLLNVVEVKYSFVLEGLTQIQYSDETDSYEPVEKDKNTETYIFYSKFVNEDTYKHNGEEVEVLSRNEYHATVRFKDGTEAEVYTSELREDGSNIESPPLVM